MKDKVKKGIVITAITGGALGLWIYDPETIKPIIDDNGQEIRFDYTDDNTGETLPPYVDRTEFISWDSIDGHLAIKNISGEGQNIKIQCIHAGASSCSSLEERLFGVAKIVEKITYEDNTMLCESGWEKAKGELLGNQPSLYSCGKIEKVCTSVEKNICTYREAIITQETKYKDEWVNVHRKPVENLETIAKFTAKDQYSTWIGDGETKYFKFKLTFPPKSNCEADRTACEFGINVYGDKGAFGKLK